MERPELTEVLEDAGLSPYQAEAYVTILELGAAPVTDVADASGVPDPRIYDVLRDLASAGYIELYEQESLHARAYSLEEVTGDLQTRASRFEAAAEEIKRRWEQPALTETSVSIVKQFETVLNNAAEWIRGAENQVQVSLAPDHYEELRPALRDAVDSDAEVHLSLFTDGETVDSFLEYENVAAVCTEARHRKIPSPFVAVVDRTKTCFAPHEGSTNEYGILVDDRTHTYVFHWFFLTNQWDGWEPYYTAGDDEPPVDYVDIRYCVRDITPLLEADRIVRVAVEGIDLGTDERRTVEGTVSDLLVSGVPGEGSPESIAGYSGQVGFVVETGDGPVEVGGWGATVEEVEAHRITILSVE